jgi:TetR/AcrR family transcriptional regulator, transcriptional repressor for nem operon
MKTRHEIVQSALRLLKRQGMVDASVADVMAEAGLTVGGFYAHFPSKETLAEETVREGLQERRAMYLRRPDQEGWARRLQSALEGYFSQEHRDDIPGGCPIPMAAMDAARSGTAAAVFVEEFAKMAETFECGRDPANPRAPRAAALGSLALMVGGMILARAAKGTALSDEILESARTFGESALNNLVRDDLKHQKTPMDKKK